MAEILKTLGFEVVVGHDLNQHQLPRRSSGTADLEDADVGLFFYAGHGLQINDKNYLVSTKAKLDNEFLISSETIELDAIIRLMESQGADQHRLSRRLPQQSADRQSPAQSRGDEARASLGRGLARVEASGRDTLVAFAAAPGQEAADGSERNSPFTAALFKHLPKPGLEVSVMLKEVAADVRRETQQRPASPAAQRHDPHVLFRQGRARRGRYEPYAQAGGTAERRPSHRRRGPARSMSHTGTPRSPRMTAKSVRTYLQRFPNGIFVELAKAVRNAAFARRVAA